jgi:acyl carrier protein
MTHLDTWDTLLTVIREMFGDDTLAIGRDTTAAEIPGWDSVAHVELMIAVEERFGIRFTTGEAAGMHNVGDMADFIDRHLQSKG